MIKAILFDCFGVLYQGASGSNANLLVFIRENLCPHYTVGILSNTSAVEISTLLTSDELGMFRPQILSKEVGVGKPDIRIYHIAAEKLGTDFHEIIFVDDREDLLTPAQELGMKTIHYRDFEQCKQDLLRAAGS